MILYILNGKFPDNSGFGRRCEREIRALAEIHDVVVLSRGQEGSKNILHFPKNVQFVSFFAYSTVVHRPDHYSSNGLYEVKRNLDLLLHLTFAITRLLWKHRDEEVKIFCVTSPLTVPLLAFVLAKILGAIPKVVSFHDLEPELAMHLKKLRPDHWVVKIERMLESVVCHGYQQILVTSVGQAERLIERNRLNGESVLPIVNSTDILPTTKEEGSSHHSDPFSKKTFVIAYLSSLSFDYTITGLMDLLRVLHISNNDPEELKVMVIGGGEGLPLLQKYVQEHKMGNHVEFYEHVDHPANLLQHADVAIIPWKQDFMTEVMLPTKLFEYLSLRLPVVAPNFGEFQRILTNNKTALLYSTDDEFFDCIDRLRNDKSLRKSLGENGYELYNNEYRPFELNKKLLAFLK